MSLIDIETRYRTGTALSEADKALLEDLIVSSRDEFSVQSALYIYGASFGPQNEVTKRADQFIRHTRVPGLTATCLKVLADFWSFHEMYRDELEKFLDYDLYEEWYDEVTMSVSFYLRHPELQSKVGKDRLDEVQRKATQAGEVDLIEFFDEYYKN